MTLYSLRVSVLAFGLTLLSPVAALPGETAGVRYLTDLSRCQPQAAVGPEVKKGCWQVIPYETVEPGTMIGAASFIDAPDLTLPRNVTGWHVVCVGFWNPHFVYDGGTTVKVKQWDYSYGLGVDGVALWDIDTLQDLPTLWPVLRRAGHRHEMEAAAKVAPASLTTIRLKKIGGCDVLQGLRAAGYSGG